MTLNPAPPLIAVIGVTGAGKSTFINIATGRDDLKAGSSIQSCTQEVETADVTIDNKVVRLIDTPGWDDTNRSDSDILKLIGRYLASTYEKNQLLSGIILLHPADGGTRAYGSEKRRTRLYRQILGEDAFSHVIIGTTMWSNISNRELAEQRIQERMDSPDFWGPMVDGGARVQDFRFTQEHAHQMIRSLVAMSEVELQIQSELVQCGGQLGATSAGQQLKTDLLDQNADYARQVKELEHEVQAREVDRATARAEMAELTLAIERQTREISRLQDEKVGHCTIL